MKLFLVLLCVSAALYGQSAAPAPVIRQQYFDNNGQPLSGGTIATYLAGTSTPVVTYSDNTKTATNGVVTQLDASGRASIWLDPTLGYKFVVSTSGGLQLYSQDGIFALTPNSGPWIVSGGTNITNTNSGFVGIGCVTPVSLLDVCGTSAGANYLVRIEDQAVSPGINLIGAGVKLGSIAADSTAAFRVRAGNDASQLVVTQGGVTIQNQTATTGVTTLTVQSGAAQGTSSSVNHLVSIKNNGGTELAFIDYAGNVAASLYNADGAVGSASRFTFQNSDSTFLVDGLGDVSMSGVLHTVGNVQFDGNLNVTGTVTCGSGCGGGGGGGGTPGLPFTSVQFNNNGAFAGNVNLVWDNVDSILYVKTGYVNSDVGFAAVKASSPSTALQYNAIQSPTGGVQARSGTFSKYIQVGESNTPPSVTGGDTFVAGAIYWDTGSAALQVYNGSAWSSLAGGTGSPSGPSNCTSGTGCATQFNSSGGFAGSSNYTWRSDLQTLTITASNSSTEGLIVLTGYIQSDGGFAAVKNSAPSTLLNYNVIQAPFGGMQALSFSAANYISTGSASADPSAPTLNTPSGVFPPGTLAWNSTLGCERIYNGSVWACLGTATGAGITSINSQTGPGFVISGSPSGVIVTTTANTAVISTIQPITTTSAVTFGSVTTSGGGAFNSTASGSTIAFLVSNNNFLVDGNGNISAAGVVNVLGGYHLSGVTVIDNALNGSFHNLTITGTCTGCSGAGGGVTSAAGSVNQVLVNGLTGTPQTGAITLSLPQQIATNSAVSFASVNTTGPIQSQASGSATAFDIANGLGNPLIMDGNGNISANGSINMLGNTGLGAYRVNGSVVIDNGRNATFQNLTVNGFCSGILCLANGQAATLQGNLTVGGSGNFFSRSFSGNGISCSGVGDGWMGWDTLDQQLIMCAGGNRYRVQLTSY